MPRYKVTFSKLEVVRRSVFVDDELDELDQDEIETEAWLNLREFNEANGEELSGWGDAELEKV